MNKLLLSVCFIAWAAVVVAGQDPAFAAEERPAVLVSLPRADLPEGSRDVAGMGTLRVAVEIDPTGSVSSVGEVTGPGAVCPSVTSQNVIDLRDAARKAASAAKFNPATRGGTPIASSGIIEIDFADATAETQTGEEQLAVTSEPESIGDRGASVPREPKRYTIRGDAYLRNDAPPPPDYKGPVNTGATATTFGRVLPKQISGGVLNGKAISLPKPSYPAAAKAVGASGAVTVQVLIIEDGSVLTATAVSGHPLLRNASRLAACEAKFSPTQLMGDPVKVSGVVTYNFVP